MRTDIDIVVALAARLAVKRLCISGVHSVVALHLAGAAAHPLVANAHQAAQLFAVVALQLGEQRIAVAASAVDIGKGVGRHHHATRGRPVVVEPIALKLYAVAQNLAVAELIVDIHSNTATDSLGLHRHTAGGAVEELLVGAKVHGVVGVLPVQTAVDAAPAVVAAVAQRRPPAGVVEHIHALVGKALKGDVLIADINAKAVLLAIHIQPQRVVVALKSG